MTEACEFIHQLRRNGFKIAVVTSSQNCTAVLKAAKLDDLFEVQVDGNTIHAQRLAGKPAPDTFLMAAKLLGVEPNGPSSSRTPSPESRPALMEASVL